jgi:hypothetical protein
LGYSGEGMKKLAYFFVRRVEARLGEAKIRFFVENIKMLITSKWKIVKNQLREIV